MADIETFKIGLAIVFFAAWSFQWYMHILAILYGKWRLHRPRQLPMDEPVKGISILKPLIGVDPHLYENLESFFTMNYPTYELIFCIEEDSDPAAMVVHSLLGKYPKIDATLFTGAGITKRRRRAANSGGAKRVGVNPKVNNMLQGYQQAKYDLVLISDSGLKMKDDTLREMVADIRDNVGLVHQMPYVCDHEGFASVLEKVYFGTQHAKMYLNADFLGINCITGMSCLFRRDVLEEAGGLQTVGQYLAEDYYIGKAFLDRGWKTSICSQPAWQNSGSTSVANFQARMQRWTKLRGAILPSTMLLEPVSEWLLLGLMSAWAVSVLFCWSPLAFFLVHTLLWFLLDYILLRTVQNGPLPFSKFEYVVGWLFRETMSLVLMLRAHSSPVLVWRSKQYLVKAHAQGEELWTQSIV